MNEYRPGRTLVLVTTALLVAGVLGDIVALAGQAVVAFGLHASLETYPDPSAPEFIAAAVLLTLGGLGQLGAFLLTVIVFLTWFYRAAKNAQGFASDPLTHGPGWAIGGFFVPFLNLARPYQMARQIETASGGISSSVIGFWWAAFLVNNIIGNIEFRMSEAGDDAMFVMMAIGSLAGATAAFFCARMMFYIEALQAERARSPQAIADVFS